MEFIPVKTLNEWFANLPLIYKLDLYNSYLGVITKHLYKKDCVTPDAYEIKRSFLD